MNADAVRGLAYHITAERGRPPGSEELAERLSVSRDQILAAFRELAGRRLLALAPGSGEIVMAPPFSAVPTGFLVRSAGRAYHANCVWDSYGVAAALRRDAEIDASCGCCGEAMRLEVAAGRPLPAEGIAHFAVPAAHWWDDIVYT